MEHTPPHGIRMSGSLTSFQARRDAVQATPRIIKTHQGNPMSKAPPKKNDAVDFLDADHIAVKKQFQAFNKLAEDKADAGKRKALADQICRALTVHATIEEE